MKGSTRRTTFPDHCGLGASRGGWYSRARRSHWQFFGSRSLGQLNTRPADLKYSFGHGEELWKKQNDPF
jgi:hypothetical protein